MARSFEQLSAEFVRKAAATLDMNVSMQLDYLGRECVNIARDRPAEESWKDRTGNLRSSIGMGVFSKGVQTGEEGFKPVSVVNKTKKGAETSVGTKGASNGKAYLNEVAERLADRHTLVVVAGMEYAEYVSIKRDVLDSAELYARQEIEGRIATAMEDTAKKMENTKL